MRIAGFFFFFFRLASVLFLYDVITELELSVML